MKKSDVLSWKKGFEAGREAERDLIRKGSLDTKRSVRLALSLIESCRRSGAWPVPAENSIWDKNVNQVRDRWMTLRRLVNK